MSKPAETDLIRVGAPVLYDPETAGEIIGRSANWMKTKARKKAIPHTRIGGETGRIMFTPEDLTEIAQSGRQAPTGTGAAVSAPPRLRTAVREPQTGGLKAKTPRRRRAA